MTSYAPLSSPPSILIAQATSLFFSTYLLGGNGTMGFITMPVILDAPSPVAARQWKKLFDGAKPVGIVCSLISMGAAGWLAWNAPPSTTRTLYSIATFILPAILPFTGVFIQPVNRKLFKKAETLSLKNLDVPEEENRRNAEGVKALLEKWTWLHKIRTGITGVGVVCLAWAIFGGESVV